MSRPAPEMRHVRCSRCGVPVPADNAFCTNCGKSLRPEPPARDGERDGASTGGAGARAAPHTPAAPPPQTPAAPPHTPAAPPQTPAASSWSVSAPRLVACPSCGATNAASRRWCGRCRAELDGDIASATAPGPAEPEESPQAEPDESSGLLVVATVVAALVIVGVLLTILSARGIGPFAGPDAGQQVPAGRAVPVSVADVEASSVLPASGGSSYEAGNLIDGDPTTAWNEAAPGDGTGEWVELRIDDPAAVSRLLVWNGYQKEERFAEHPRVRNLRIDAEDRTFVVTLLDEEGPQSVGLPAAVTTGTIRLTIDSTYPGDRYNDAALSEVEVYAQPAE